MISQTIDATGSFNALGKYNIDLSGWDYAVVNIITPGGTVNFNGTNDANAKTGISDGSAWSAINWQPEALTNVATGTSVVSTAATGNFKLNVGARFLQLVSSSTASKVIIYLTRIT